MTKEEIKDFSMKISQSSKTELVVITYEIIINYIESAKECHAGEDMEGFVFNIKKAKQFVNDLSVNLDFHYKLSFDLMSLYMFINKSKDGLNNICGNNVSKFRTALKISQRELADRMQLVGIDIDKNAIQRIECGKRFVTDIEIIAFSKIFNVSYDQLLNH